jgi:hypothetical protein
MKISKAARRILGNLVGHADQIVSELIRNRGGNASNVRALVKQGLAAIDCIRLIPKSPI